MEQLQQLLDSAWQMVVNNYLHVVAAIVILVVGRMVAGWARKLITRGLKRGDVDATLIPFVAKLVYYSILAVVVIAALNRLGVATTSVIAIFGAAGLAVGLALQGTLANFASGVMLLIFRPVEEIGIFSTTLKTADNIKITVPNSQIYGATISNFNGYDTRRVDMVMGISYDDNIQTAMDTISSIVTADDRVLAEPEVLIAVDNLGDSSVDLVVRPWCNAADYWGLKRDLTRKLKEGLEAAGCSIPYPQTDVHLQQVAS